MADNEVTIKVGSHDTSAASLDDLKKKLSDLGRVHESATVDLKGRAAYDADKLKVQLAALGRRVDSPKISIGGIQRAELEMERIKLQLDELGKKSETILVRIRTSIMGGVAGAAGKLAGAGGLLTLGSGALSLAGPLAAAGLAVGAFGAVAIPVFSKVNAAQQALTKAQEQYEVATTKSQRLAALKAEKQATDGLTGSEKSLLGPLSQLSQMWGKVESSLAPVVVNFAKVAISLAKDLLPAFKVLATVGGNALETILGYLGQFVRTPYFASLIKQMGQLANQVAPILGKALVGLLKVFLQLFIQAGPAGIKILQTLLPLLITWVSDLTPVITALAEVTAWFLTLISKSPALAAAFAVVGAAVALATGGLSVIIPAILIAIAAIVNLWRHSQTFRNIMTEVWSVVGQVVVLAIDGILIVLKAMADGALEAAYIVVKALSFIPGPTQHAMKTAAAAIEGFKGSVDKFFDGAIGKVHQWQDYLAKAPKIVKLEGHITDLQAKLKTAQGLLRNPDLTKTRRSRIEANIAQLQRQIALAKAALASLQDRTVNVFVNTVGRPTGMPRATATGGIIGAAGGGPRGNMVMVGEQGRELVSLPAGSTVHSNPDTERMMTGGGGRGQQVTVVFDFTGADSALVTAFKKIVRVRGGNPEVFGH